MGNMGNIGKVVDKSKIKLIGSSLVIVALLVLVIFGIRYRSFSSKINKVEIDRDFVTDFGKLESNPNEDITNIAIFGSDTEDKFGKADATMILSINKNTKKVKLLSFMEDISLMLPEGGTLRLNETLNEGGPELIIKTLNYNFDLNIDKFIYVDLALLPNVVDNAGGITANIDSEDLYKMNHLIVNIDEEKGTYTDQIFTGGLRVLNGIQSLAYCKLDSANNHKNVFGSVFNTYSDNLSKFASNVLPIVSTNMKTTELISVISSTSKAYEDNIENITLPLEGDFSNGLTGVDNRIINIDATKNAIHEFINN